MNAGILVWVCVIALGVASMAGAETAAQPWEVDLVGDWQFTTGDDESWADPVFDDTQWDSLHAPALWDGQGYADYNGYGWYRKRFFVPEELRGKALFFEHGGVDDDDWVYVNGKKIGEGKGCYKARQYGVPQEVINFGGENLVAVRIYDGAMGGGLARGPLKIREPVLTDHVEIVSLSLRSGRGKKRMLLQLEVANKETRPNSLRVNYHVVDYFGRECASGKLTFDLAGRARQSGEVGFTGGECTEYRVRLNMSLNGRKAEIHRRLVADAMAAARQTLLLSGEWEMLLPAGDKLVFPPKGKWQKVQVPMADWGAWKRDNHRAWFRRKVAIPAAMKGKRVKLRFEAVAHHAQVYFNGRKLAEHLGGFRPFEVDLTDTARFGQENEILVGVTDWVVGLVEGVKIPSDLNKMPKDSMLIPYGTRVHTLRGIWQDVYLVAHRAAGVGGVFVMPSVRKKKLAIQVQVRNEGRRRRRIRLTNEVFEGKRRVFSFPVRSFTLQPGEERMVELERNWPNPHLWWPDDPHLYVLSTKVAPVARGESDEVRTRFGFREFWIDGLDYRLNGAVCKLRGLVCAPRHASREEIRDYYLQAKEAGFSMVRFHMQPRSHYYYDIADEVGMCIKEESAFYCASKPAALADDRLWKNLTPHIEGMVRRARNHPSVCIWSVENEILHCGGTRVSDAGAHIFELGELIARLDPTRPIEYEGDGDMEGRAKTVNIHYPREFGCHDHNLWPNDAYWLGSEGNDRWPRDLVWKRDKPLIIGEFCYYPYSRPPGGLSVFMGDEVYRSKQKEHDAHVQGVKFLCDACRRLGVAGLNPWVRGVRYATECLKPIAVTFKEYDAHFFAGETVTRSLAVHNDTLKKERLRLVCSVLCHGKRLSGREWELELEPGEMREISFSWKMPAVDERAEVTLDVKLLRGEENVFKEERRFDAFPRKAVRIPGRLRVMLYDPAGETARALKAVGLSLPLKKDLASLDPANCDLLLVGRNASAGGDFGRHAGKIRGFVSEGGKVFCFEQERYGRWLPVPLRIDARHNATIAFCRAPGHPVLEGVGPDDLKFWRGDHLVAAPNFVKPRRGAFRVLADTGGKIGLNWSPLIELPYGKGFYVLSQFLLTEKLSSEPAAQRLLQNVLDYAASYRPAPPLKTGVVAAGDAKLKQCLSSLGITYDDLSEDFGRRNLTRYGLLIVAGSDPALEAVEKLRAFAAGGGKVLIHRPTGESESKLKSLVPGLKAVKRCHVRGRLVKVRDDSLMAGLSNSDFFWYRGDCWYENWEGRGTGIIQDPAEWRIEVEKGKGSAFTRPAAVVSVPHGQGVFIVDTIRWDDPDPAVSQKAGRIASTLLLNLGAEFQTEKSLRNISFRPIPLREHFNRALRDETAGDGKGGWTDAGENDLRNLPLGRRSFAGVTYETENGCLALRSPAHLPSAPHKVQGIKVGGRFDFLFFLHGAAWSPADGKTVAVCRVRYSDGSHEDIAMARGVNVGDWWNPEDVPLAEIAWTGSNPVHSPVGLYSFAWRNPHAKKEITAVDLDSTDSDSIYLLVALTGGKKS